jgi:hypothetical protein
MLYPSRILCPHGLSGLVTGVLVLLFGGVASGCEGAFQATPSGPADGRPVDFGPGAEGQTNPLCTASAPGATPMRRLTRNQYRHLVTDSFAPIALSLDEVVSALPEDLASAGFASNAGAPVSDLLYGALGSSAQAIADQVVRTMDLAPLCDLSAAPETACAERFVDTFAPRLYRGALSAEERDRLLALYRTGSADPGAFAKTLNPEIRAGLALVVEGMLQAPRFIYRLEDSLPAAGGAWAALDGDELATRLALFFWSSTPDDELRSVAASGALFDPMELRHQASRMLQDPRADRSAKAFLHDWLELDALRTEEKDATTFPEFTSELAEAMVSEVEGFGAQVLRSDTSTFASLLLSTATVASPEVAKLYGLDVPPGATPPTAFALDETQRAGVLTRVGFLAAHALPNQTSPVRRGLMFRDRLLCQTIAPPPPTADTTPPQLDPSLPTRERWLAHSASPECAGCHGMLDPVGLAFEHFDGLGRYRATENGLRIDVTGTVVGSDIAEPFDGVLELSALLAKIEQASDCFVENWFQYVFGRLPEAADSCSLKQLKQAFRASHGDIKGLMLELTQVPAFRNHSPLMEAP